METEKTGIVFDIQHYSIHDGPGIRTSVFLKGCPLKCLWCQNPESQKHYPQLMFDAQKCTGCSHCVAVCSQNAIRMENGKSRTDRSKCVGCGSCVSVCLPEARSISGKRMTVEEVCREVMADKLFYQETGGITLTGGDPLNQPVFSKAILARCKELGITTCIETCGFGNWDIFKPILKYTDTVLYDIKHINSEKHKQCTGVGNELILDNIKRISAETGLPIFVRVPVVPGYNDEPDNYHAMGRFISENVPTCQAVELLPYHRLGEGKKLQLEEDIDMESRTPSESEIEHLCNIIRSYGIEVKP